MSTIDDKLLIPEGAQYATARQLAHRYQVSVKWVGARGEQLGATPISDSANSELRYHLATADAYMQSRQRRGHARAPRRKADTMPQKTRSGAPLLSFR
jgi:hypothetical protein